MGARVYILTPLGRRALAGERVSVPPQLRPLLRAINGQRSRKEILALCGRSAINAGGLSWLVSSGYIERATPLSAPRLALKGDDAGSSPPTESGAAPKLPAPPLAVAAPPLAAAPAEPGPSTISGGRRSTSTQPGLLPMQETLAGYMLDAIRRHLVEEADIHRRRVQRAESMSELLSHLNPLIDALVEAAGPQAAAEFADGAAAILQPGTR